MISIYVWTPILILVFYFIILIKGRGNKQPENHDIFYDIYKVRKTKFYGLCGSKHHYIACSDEYTASGGLCRGEIIACFVSESEMLTYKPKVVLLRDSIGHDMVVSDAKIIITGNTLREV